MPNRLQTLCILWYLASVLTNTSSKSILNTFNRPATLTVVQFVFVTSYCLIFSSLATRFPSLRILFPALKHPIRPPTREVIKTTIPLALFQIGGHLLSSTATAKIPVSLVHTIKGLSPLFTVVAYRVIYNIRYPVATYVSLAPLTLGVMLACSGTRVFGNGGELLGIVYAFVAALIFVTQNIFSKRLFNEAAKAELEGPRSKRLDKLNLLCYSSALAFILTVPIWFWSEGILLLKDFYHDGSLDLESKPNSFDHGRLFVEFVFNGTFHFGQNILAFILLSMVSPVTYSVASLLKRVFVISVTLIWFRSPTTWIQGVGISLTFLGLWMYDRSSESNKADRKASKLAQQGRGTPLLPLAEVQGQPQLATPYAVGGGAVGEGGGRRQSPHTSGESPIHGKGQRSTPGPTPDGGLKKSDGHAARIPGNGAKDWLPPRTRQEETWRVGDQRAIKT